MTSLSDNEARHKEDPVLGPIERELRKGNFLIDDDRSLARIIEEDAAECSRLGIDLDSAYFTLERLLKDGRSGLGEPVIVDETFEVRVTEYRGALPCPWQDRFFAPKAVADAANLLSGVKLRFTPLGVHLAKEHGFFQGKGSPFRMEPAALKAFLQGARFEAPQEEHVP
jgi:hypothetical protein